MASTSKIRYYGILALGLFILVGTYNALVINVESSISEADYRFIKRIDEQKGIVIKGRKIAASAKWTKLKRSELPVTSRPQPAGTPKDAPVEADPEVLQEDLALDLVEVINPKKWPSVLNPTQFSGNLASGRGVIEALHIALPEGEGLSLSFAELRGNVFEYEHNGEVQQAMLYQVDPQSYMVSLTSGPLEGTRLRFSKNSLAAQNIQAQEALAENYDIQAGNFGDPAPEQEPSDGSVVQSDKLLQLEGQTFNMDQGES